MKIHVWPLVAGGAKILVLGIITNEVVCYAIGMLMVSIAASIGLGKEATNDRS